METYPLSISNSNINWTRVSRTYKSQITDTQRKFIVGNASSTYNYSYFTNLMVINLTDHYGQGYEPTAEWLDQNIEYFEGTMSYFKEENVLGGESREIEITAQKGRTDAMPVCIGENNAWISVDSNMTIRYDRSTIETIHF